MIRFDIPRVSSFLEATVDFEKIDGLTHKEKGKAVRSYLLTKMKSLFLVLIWSIRISTSWRLSEVRVEVAHRFWSTLHEG
jgi:hypothetical protein